MTDLFITFGPWFKIRIVRPPVLSVYLFNILEKSITIGEGSNPVEVNLGDNMKTNVHLVGKDPAGLVGTFTALWTVDDPSVVKITPDASGLNCRFEAAIPAKLGDAVVTMTDTDNPALAPLVFNCHVTAEQISEIGVVIDPPTERTADDP